MDLRERGWGGMNHIHLAQDRGQCWDFCGNSNERLGSQGHDSMEIVT